MLLDSLRRHGLPLQARRVVEWGCGGGMNAVHFARGTDQFYGVDISPASLQECARQLARESLPGFVPVLVDANAPQSALAQIGAPCDWFICTYVVELLPSEAHALALLDTAHALLRAGGVALVQLRISRGGWLARSRPWDYAANMAHNVRFTRSAFAAACGARGFRVLDVLDQGAVPELREKDYAVFVLQR
jgi:SAM-dependent methyltransferase